jgi:hypothetical protein
MSEPTPSRQLWLIIWGALTLAPIVYVIVGSQMMHQGEPPAMLATMRMAFLGLSALAFLAGSFVMSRAASPGGFPRAQDAASSGSDIATPAQFQTRSVIAMAFFESISVYGFVLLTMGGQPLQNLPWSAASVAAMLGIVLPSGLSYWRRWEDSASRATPKAIG